MNAIMIEIRKRLKEALKEKGIKQQEIAKLCGKGSSWISQLLNVEDERYKNQQVMITDLLKIAEYLKIDVCELLPVPPKIDITKMSFMHLIETIVRNECERYLCELGFSLNKTQRGETWTKKSTGKQEKNCNESGSF